MAATRNVVRTGPVLGEPAELVGSSWQSLIRGTGTIETDFLNGEIVLIARLFERTAPVNAQLTAVARRAARERMQPGAMTAAELRTLIHSVDGDRRSENVQ